MPAIECPVEGCTQTFREDLHETVLNNLIDLHARTSHPPPPQPAQPLPAKVDKVRRPTISSAGSSEDWAYFLSRWQEYKLATRMPAGDTVIQLLECTSEELRKDINRNYGTLTNDTEVDALTKIKFFAVKAENILVARAKLQNITQDRDESVRAFCARLKGQAGVCDFRKQKTCECEREVVIDFSEDIIRDALVRNLADEDIKLEVLGQPRQDLTLDETLQMIEAKESGKRSAGLLTNTTAYINATSAYRKNHKEKFSPKPRDNQPTSPTKPSNSFTKTCNNCGKQHSGWRKFERRQNCPAFNHVCAICGIKHHFESVCRSRRTSHQNKPTNPSSHDAVFQENTVDNLSFFNDAIFASDQSCTASSESVI